MDGAGNKNTRAEWYNLIHPMTSPIFSRTPKDHRNRRQVLNKALSTKALNDYLPRILSQVDALEQLISRFEGGPVLINDVMMWFAFDSMGEFAFNQSFNMMKTGEWHEAIRQQRSALSILGFMNPTVWAIRVGFAFLSLVPPISSWKGMIDFCDKCMKIRMTVSSFGHMGMRSYPFSTQLMIRIIKTFDQRTPEQPDIAQWLIEEFKTGKNATSQQARENLLLGNTTSLIVGGSDTTGPSLILMFYFLALYPKYAEDVWEEMKTVNISDAVALAALPRLDGFINETMRLIPAALTMGTRITPAEGIDIDGTWIPGNVRIVGPRYTVFRLKAAFAEPTSFIPERWYSRPELILDEQTFTPFGLGRRVCVGKGLAMTQIRIVTARLLTKYHVRFAPGTDPSAVERDMRDQMTAQAGDLQLLFEPRST